MVNTNLIMIEGIPGSGKSTTAQFISRIMSSKGYHHKWWYEEEHGHPVYIYDDYKSMQLVVAELTNGNYRDIINSALVRWKEFVTSIQSSSKIIIVDSCFFGYLTWSLFPFDVPKQDILKYIKDVEQIIKPLNPQLIYFYQTDVGAALKKICTRRGGSTEDNFIRASTHSLYGKKLGLDGFEGMVLYWQEYRRIIDEAFRGLDCSKVAIENTEGEWSLYGQKVLEFLDIQQDDDRQMDDKNYKHLVGSYFANKEGLSDSSIQIDSGYLVVDGLPQVWTRSMLIPISYNLFHVQSLPIEVRFIEDKDITMRVNGPSLLDGKVDYSFTKYR
jgi:thymidylate kinase